MDKYIAELINSAKADIEGKGMKNEMELCISSLSCNESFARTVVAAFTSQLNPTLEELSDIKTAVSEAVTNAVIHGYDNKEGKIYIKCSISESELTVEVIDQGIGIVDIEQAMVPLYTTRPELERSGMGFAFMEAFMDDLMVYSKAGEGTRVYMKKKIMTT